MKKRIEKLFTSARRNLDNHSKLDLLFVHAASDYKSSKVNVGQMQLAQNLLRNDIKRLSDVEFRVFSQFGDDGIIAWLSSVLPLPNKTFIEFGVEDYKESNTRFLLVSKYWSGLVIDGSPDNIRTVKSEQISTFYDLQAECSFITTSNINNIIESARFHEDVGILSVDIDGNDYWVLEAITCIRPIILIVEYNALFGFEHPYTIPYNDSFVRGNELPFQCYGTSLKSVFDMASCRDYSFIGCNSAGNNAYFIRNDFMHYIPLPAIKPEEGYNFSSFSEVWDKNGVVLRGIQKVMSLKGVQLFNTSANKPEVFDADSVVESLLRAKKVVRI